MLAIWAEVRCPLVRQGGFGTVCGSSYPRSIALEQLIETLLTQPLNRIQSTLWFDLPAGRQALQVHRPNLYTTVQLTDN
jgi:hypothetical protein